MPDTKSNKETRTLQEDPSMFIMMIKAQAGTLSKAALEGVMNSVDSFFRANQEGITLPDKPRIDVTVSASKLQIIDNALGFRSREEILDIWEVFGRPHPKDDLGFSKDTKFGKFRIGRGQLFAFGKNTWRSNEFRMDTDIDHRFREYDLTTGLARVPGTEVHVDLYQSLSLREAQSTVEEISRFVKYVDVDVFVNGNQVNTPPDSLKWDLVNDLAYIKKKATQGWGSSGLDVYQQGVFVENMRGHEFGIEGTVVVRDEVELNFARNQVLRQGKAWKKISKFLSMEGIKETVRKKRLTKYAARNFIAEYTGGDGELVSYEQFFETAAIPDVTGKLWSPRQLLHLTTIRSQNPKIHRDPDGNILVGFAPLRDSTGEAVLLQKKALVLDEDIFKVMRLDHLPKRRAAEAVLDTIRGVARGSELEPGTANDRFHGALQWTNHAELLEADAGDLDYHRFGVDDYTPREQDFIRVVSAMWNYLGRRARGDDRRRIGMGESRLAAVWTDGSTYVTFSREWLSGIKMGLERGWNEVALKVVEMYAYKVDSADDPQFKDSLEYLQDLRDLLPHIHEIARYAVQDYRKAVTLRTKRLPAQMQDEMNREAEAHAKEHFAYQDKEEKVSTE